MRDGHKRHTVATEMAATAEQLETNLGTAGGIMVAGMLIAEGLHALAEAIQGSREVTNDRWEEVIRAIKATKSGQS